MDKSKKSKKEKEVKEEQKEERSRAWPKADNQLTKQVLDLMNQAQFYK